MSAITNVMLKRWLQCDKGWRSYPFIRFFVYTSFTRIAKKQLYLKYLSTVTFTEMYLFKESWSKLFNKWLNMNL